MNSGYFKSKETIKNINYKYIFALLPLIVSGFYKNGIKLYSNHLVSFELIASCNLYIG